jgi:ABC-type multidrug transport system ATPase subunit
MLEVRDLGVDANGRRILDRVSFEVARGEVLAVLGPNGSGKTTLLEAIAGLRRVARGEVRVAGRTLRRFEEHAAALAYMVDDDRLPEEVDLRTALGLRRDDPRVERFGVAHLLAARATELSRGEQKRARLCATLSLERPVLLLDEPFAAFDPRQLRGLLPDFRAAVREQATVVTVHQMSTAAVLADRLLLLCAGRVLTIGTLDELRAQVDAPNAGLEEVFLRLLDREEAHAPA